MKKLLLFTVCFIFLVGCKTKKDFATTSDKNKQVTSFDTQAHRGGRGLMPENTIPAMLDAIDRNVVTLELDLQISKDKQVLVSHDPYFNHKITTNPDGKYLTADESKLLLLYTMNYDSIKKYDVGIKPTPDFPQKKNIAVYKPLLSDLIKESEKYATQRKRTILYNMEIKSSQKGDNKNHPPVEEFVDLAIDVISQNGVIDRTVIQSFDIRALQVMHQKYPHVKTSYLVETKTIGSLTLKEQLDKLGFIPDIYSPEYKLVTPEMIQYCHSLNVKVIPWTVNTIESIKLLKEMGVDGIISDYPNLFDQL